MVYEGFDSSHYPGDWEMQMLRKHTNLCWVGYYINRENCRWRPGLKSYLDDLGWGTLPVFCGHQTEHLTPEEGKRHGDVAADQAGAHGYPAGSGYTIYIDLEGWGPRRLPYVQAWAEQMLARGYCPGAYCEIEAVGPLRQAVSVMQFFLAVRHGTGRIFESDRGLYHFVQQFNAKPPVENLTPRLELHSAPPPDTIGAVQYSKMAKLTFPISEQEWSMSHAVHRAKRANGSVVVTIGDLLNLDAIDLNSSRSPNPALVPWLYE